jgi:hypothetical protein
VQKLTRVRERYPGFGELEAFVRKVAWHRPLLVLLFGSLATGEFTQHSDADVLVIFNRLVDWMTVYECSTGWVQPLVWELGEALREIEEGNTLLIEAIEDGIPLLNRVGTYELLREAPERAKSLLGLVRVEQGWRRAK